MCRLAKYYRESDSHADAFAAARKRVTPTGLRQFVLEVPNVQWDDIGGNETLKTEVQQVKNPRQIATFNPAKISGCYLAVSTS